MSDKYDDLRAKALAHLSNYDDSGSTHWDGCEATHWRCCILALLDELAALRKTMLERDEQWLEMIELCDEHMAKIKTPMESPSTDAWMTVSKNLGLARVVIES